MSPVHSPDPFEDLSTLVLPPEAVAAAQATKPARRRKRPRIRGEFYLCPVVWADRAAAAVSSRHQLIIAFRIFRRWLTRKPHEDTIVVSNLVVAGPGFSREAKRQAVRKLTAVGLLQVVQGGHGRAPRIRVVED
jgi:hypothetical protein